MFTHKHSRGALKVLPLLLTLALVAIAAPAEAANPVTTATLNPSALHANTTSTLTITGSNLSGASVTTTSPELITLGSPSYLIDTNSNTYITIPVTVGTFTGASPTSANITVTGANNTVSDSLSIDPDPTVTGTYYAAPSSTNLELAVTGTYFSSTGVTVASTNPAFSANVVSSSADSVALLVTTTAAAVDGTSSTMTITNPDGSSVNFVLHGGAAISKPTVSLVPTVLHSGTNTTLTINGGPFVTGATVTTTTASVISLGTPDIVSSTQITVPITVKPITGTVAVTANITVTNPDTGTGTANLTIEADPTTTGTYFVAPNSTNTELTITGANFSSSGVTASSSNSAFSVVVVGSSSSTVTLLVSTTAAAKATTNVTLTNPDGSSVIVLITAGTAAVTVVKPTVTLSPTAMHADTMGTLTITGGAFVSGATVTTTSSELITLGSVTFVSTTDLTVPVTVASVTGTASTPATITVTNPDGGTGTATLTVEPNPAIPGTYNVPPSSTNYELTVTGSSLSSTGITATSSNPAFSVSVVSSTTSSVALLVTTTAAAAAGTATITLTNPDGSKATFTLTSKATGTTTTTLPGTKPPTTTTTLPTVSGKEPAALAVYFSTRSGSISSTEKTYIVTYAREIPTGSTVTLYAYASTQKTARLIAHKVALVITANASKPRVRIILAVRKTGRYVLIKSTKGSVKPPKK